MDDPTSEAKRSRALAEQVKLLVRTEQRLNRVQRSFEAQLQRMETLNTFALKAGQSETEAQLLEQALEVLLVTYPYDQAVAFVVFDEGYMRAVACASVAGRAGDSRRLLLDPTFAAVTPVPELAHPTGIADLAQGSPDEALRGPLECVERIFGGTTPSATRACLTLPISCDGKVAAMLIARKVDTLVSHTDSLPTASDVPFWRLFTRHVETTLEAFRLRSRMQTVLAHLPSALLVLRGEKLVAANRAAAHLLGRTHEHEVDGLPLSRVVPPDEFSVFNQMAHSAASGSALHLIGRSLVRQDGERVPVEIVAVPLLFEGIPATLIIAEDMTERARMRTELAHAERLATVGVLAAGVAHEVNNPLTYMMYHLERLVKNQTDPESVKTAELVLDGAHRIRNIVRDLQTFATATEERTQPVRVDAVIEKVLALAEPEVRYRAKVVRDIEPLPAVWADEGRLAQVFLNLVINAAHAMDEGEPERNTLSIRGRRSGDHVVIDVADTGAGIAPANLKRIFEPFFSTKVGPHGSGLGLSISRNIVERFEGRIEVASTLGKGSCFSVVLKVSDEDVPVPSIAPAVRASPSARARVLVIDDDERILAVCAALLEEDYDVHIALGGAAALRLLDQPFEAIVCDLMMPGMTGMDLHDWICQNRPELSRRVIFLTGGSFTKRSDEFLARTSVPVVEKPMHTGELLNAIASICALK